MFNIRQMMYQKLLAQMILNVSPSTPTCQVKEVHNNMFWSQYLYASFQDAKQEPNRLVRHFQYVSSGQVLFYFINYISNTNFSTLWSLYGNICNRYFTTMMMISKFNGTSTPKGSYSAETGVEYPASLNGVH